MIESPWLKEIVEEAEVVRMRQAIEDVLIERFGASRPDETAALQKITNPELLRDLLRWAVRCPDHDGFRTRL